MYGKERDAGGAGYAPTMPFTIVRFEETPNPNAMKCWLDRPISAGPRSFRDAAAAASDPVAQALFSDAEATCVLFCDNWLTVNKQATARWPAIKTKIARVLAAVP